jgi:hypothetical protein
MAVRADEMLQQLKLALPPDAAASPGIDAPSFQAKPKLSLIQPAAPTRPLLPWLTLSQPQPPAAVVVPQGVLPFQPETVRTPFGRLDVPQFDVSLPTPVTLPKGTDMTIELQRRPSDGDIGTDVSGTIRLKTVF